MNWYGKIRELAQLLYRKSGFAVTVEPSTVTADTTFQYPAAGGGTKAILTADSTAALTGKSFDADGAGNSITNIENADIKAGAAIDASKIADGSVSSTEFQYINGVTSGIQGQIDAKAAGAASSTDNAIARFDSTTGKIIQNSVVTVGDTGIVAGATIDGDDNTVQDLPETALKTNITNASKFFTRDASGIPESATKAVPAGAVVGTTDTQALTNKDFDGGTASNTSRFTIPKAAKTTLDALTRKEGTLVYASDLDKPYYDDGSTLREVGSGSGSGGINYITNGTFEENNVTGWATYLDSAATTPVNGTGGSPVSTFASTASGPLRGTYSGLFTKGAANRQGEGFSYDFTIATADVSRPLAISWEGSASANYTGSSGSEYMVCYVYDVTNSTLIATSTVNVAQGATKGYTTFLATTSTSYRLIFHVAGTGTSAWTYLIDSVSVSPFLTVQGAAVSYLGELAFAPNSGAFGTVSNSKFYCYRSGNRMIVEGSFQSGTPAGGVSYIDLPSGYTVDTTALSTSTDSYLGYCARSLTGAAQSPFTGNNLIVFYDLSAANSGRINLSTTVNGSQDGTFTAVVGTSTVQASDKLIFKFEFPVSQWQNTVTMADRAVEEYASNSSTSVTTDTTSFAYGSTGSAIPNGASGVSVFTKTVRFTSPIQATDNLFLEIQPSGTGPWMPLDQTNDTVNIVPLTRQGGTFFGIGFDSVSGTDAVVKFGRYPITSNTTYNTAGADWNAITSTTRWRLRKVSGGASVGYPIAPANISLINSTENYSGNTKMGLMTYYHGTSYNGGIAPTISGHSISGAYGEFVPRQRADGTWEMFFTISGSISSAQNVTLSLVGITSLNKIQTFSAGQAADATTYPVITYINSSTADFFTKYSASITSVFFSGRVVLSSKPTWAY